MKIFYFQWALEYLDTDLGKMDKWAWTNSFRDFWGQMAKDWLCQSPDSPFKKLDKDYWEFLSFILSFIYQQPRVKQQKHFSLIP